MMIIENKTYIRIVIMLCLFNVCMMSYVKTYSQSLDAEFEHAKKIFETTEENKQLKTQLKNAEIEKGELKKMRKDYAKAKTSIYRIEQTERESERRIGFLEVRMDELLKDKEKLLRNNSSLYERIKDGKIKNDRLEKKVEELDNQISQNKQEIRWLKQENDTLTSTIVYLHREIKDYENTIKSYRTLTEKQKRQLREKDLELLQKEWELYQSELEVFRCQKVINELGTYAGFEITRNKIFFSLKENRCVKACRVKRKNLVIHATYFAPSKEMIQHGSTISNGTFHLYKKENGIENEIAPPIALMFEKFGYSGLPNNIEDTIEPLRYSELVKAERIFVAETEIPKPKLKKGDYMYKIFMNGKLISYCHFTLSKNNCR